MADSRFDAANLSGRVATVTAQVRRPLATHLMVSNVGILLDNWVSAKSDKKCSEVLEQHGGATLGV